MIGLDTHIWLWWINDEIDQLGTTRKEWIEASDNVAVSAISCFEVAWLERHHRIILPIDRTSWFEKALEGSGITLMPITLLIASVAVDLPEYHRDPQDCLILQRPLLITRISYSWTVNFRNIRSWQTSCWNLYVRSRLRRTH